MREFYPGLHQPHDAKHFDLACVSIRRLWRRKKPLGPARVIVDSGAFMELKLYGEYRDAVDAYADALFRLHTNGVVNIVVAVAQDYMCEPFMLARTGKTVEQHQRLTIERYDALLSALCSRFRVNHPDQLPFGVMPVLQGYAPADYTRHIQMYGDRLTHGMWVGVGSVCKRNGDPAAIVAVLRAIRAVRLDLKLHGFGVKLTSLAQTEVLDLLDTSDSMAWSYAARRQGRDGNDWHEAAAYRDRVVAAMLAPRRAYQLALAF